jgi:hypothetical protein
MITKTKLPPCGNPECSCSTGIHDGLTFGSGELDDLGYWDKPCDICAREGDKRNKYDVRANISIMIRNGKTKEEAIKEVRERWNWLFIECWPFKESA